MKKYSALIVILLPLFLISCATTGLSVPGENGKRISNITAEYFNIAQSYEELKNYTKAIEFYNLASSNSSLKNSCMYKIGRCYALNKDWDNAEASYKKLLSQDPDNLNLKVSLAYIKAMQNDFKGAENIYEQLVKDNPTDVSLYKNYLSILIADEKAEEAEALLALMKENFPDEESISTFETKLNELKKKKGIVSEESTEKTEGNPDEKNEMPPAPEMKDKIDDSGNKSAEK